MIVAIGNMKKLRTYIPPDKNKLFMEKKLSDIASIADIPRFTYDQVTRRASTVYIIWFRRKDKIESLVLYENMYNKKFNSM